MPRPLRPSAARRRQQRQMPGLLSLAARERDGRRSVPAGKRDLLQRGRRSSDGASCPRQDYIRSRSQPQVEDPHKPALEHQGLKGGKLRLKESFSGAEQGEDGADDDPALTPPGQKVKRAEYQAHHHEEQRAQAGAVERVGGAKTFHLELSKAARQQYADQTGQTGYYYHEPDVVSSQRCLSPFQKGCAAPACSPR